ncbi:hypothetical protein N7537_008752 [Penicillium hordei]|uniref:Uncharacterized protein n=1 Tax=Penicillium hordei TaxID=40994 RepID=A0AAD6H1Y2_9EURO|nr:uncharacterized protein N7537_008752 [Penicillium hordei]KAJ5598668.1 hypothetical protein N7537_008752 [Penicillium hordei]
MHLVHVAAFACAVISASAFEFPDFVPLHRRQDPGTPAYECHANCGGIITASRTDGYCDANDFKTELTDCLNCAVEFDIWKYYGGSVSKAATACGLDATPVEASSTSTKASSTSTEASATSTEESSTATEESVNSVATDPVTSTGTTVASTSVSPPRVSGSSRPSSLIPSATPAGSSTASTPSSSPVYTGGATINAGSGLVSGAFAGCLIAVFM